MTGVLPEHSSTPPPRFFFSCRTCTLFTHDPLNNSSRITYFELSYIIDRHYKMYFDGCRDVVSRNIVITSGRNLNMSAIVTNITLEIQLLSSTLICPLSRPSLKPWCTRPEQYALQDIT